MVVDEVAKASTVSPELSEGENNVPAEAASAGILKDSDNEAKKLQSVTIDATEVADVEMLEVG